MQDEHPTQKIRGISGEEIFIHTGPGESFPRLVNEKASASMGKTDYCAVDRSVKVVVLETKGAWSKINVVDPDWLTATYLGWIPSKYILNGLAEEEPVAKLDSREYEIIKTKHNSAVQNYAVLLKRKKFDKKSLHEFIRSFRQNVCTGNCNVNVYDSKVVLPYLDEYPLSRKHYLIVADHFLAMSTFDVPEASDWYPYQDFQYGEYGGRHWKKKPIR
ncbi:SH3 domain-containing protein [Spirosoma gilvum]